MGNEGEYKTSYGEHLVGVSFNPSARADVDEIKKKAAELIDLIFQKCGDRRNEALAITAIEEGAMWAVKAKTKPLRT